MSKVKKPIFLVTYAAWCVPGKGEILALNKLAKEFHKEIEFVVIVWGKKQEVRTNFYNARCLYGQMNLFTVMLEKVAQGACGKGTFIQHLIQHRFQNLSCRDAMLGVYRLQSIVILENFVLKIYTESSSAQVSASICRCKQYWS